VIDYPWRIRAGDVIMLADLDPLLANIDEPFCDASSGITGLVLQTNYSWEDNSLRIEVNNKDGRYESLLARLGISGSLG
jgi:hypothetical protein